MLAFANSRSEAGPNARKQPRQRRSRETVEVILDAATRIFATRGYEAATTNHIAAKAGVSIGSLYQYFPDKASLAAALEARHIAESGTRLVALMQTHRTAAPRIWVARFIDGVVAENLAPHSAETYGVTPRTPAVRVQLEALVASLATLLAARLTGRKRATRARVAVVAALVLVHELVIGTPPSLAAKREVTAMVANYLA